MATSDDLSLFDKTRETALTGITVVVPLLITLYVVVVLLKFVRNMLIPILGLVPVSSILVLGGIAVLVIVSMIMMVGFVAHSPVGERAIDNFDYAISQIPGLGTVYRSFRRMGDAMVESDEDHFRDVKLLEFPTDDTYTFAFVTAETPDEVRKATGEEKMTTVFLPMAPNPVMGGFVVNVPNDDLLDVDIPLEVAFRALVTSGVGLDEMGASTEGLSEDQLRRLTGQDVARYQD
ncbi:DUF502 domain-containing protein [Haladaptatus sp. AB643]|uniref:DUF502 domain-containing protein n=2 Tax=unclassified Haladaptatus TaxID=2622732 RepID=UPI00209BDA6A|nr:DUF502 domain-containing protein [Haladaptatus sp. AB643]MCO8245824.1 DUF502 domain-containing protein [Haladaptatus sp. AB643]